MIYFVHNPARGLIKIGTTRNIERRMAQLQSGSCDSLQLIGEWIGDREEEILWHRRFQPWRTHGEWFEDNELLLADIHYHNNFVLYIPFDPFIDSKIDPIPGQYSPIFSTYLIALRRAHKRANTTLYRSIMELTISEGNLVITWMIPPDHSERLITEMAWNSEFGDPSTNVEHRWYHPMRFSPPCLVWDGEEMRGSLSPAPYFERIARRERKAAGCSTPAAS